MALLLYNEIVTLFFKWGLKLKGKVFVCNCKQVILCLQHEDLPCMTWWEGAGVAVQEPWSGEQRSVILLTLLIPCPAGTSFAFQRQKKKKKRERKNKERLVEKSQEAINYETESSPDLGAVGRSDTYTPNLTG